MEGSKYYQSPLLYKDNGFLEEKDADAFIGYLQEEPAGVPVVEKLEMPSTQVITRPTETTALSAFR